MSDVAVVLLDRFGTKITELPDATVKSSKWTLCKEGSASFDIDALAPGAENIRMWDTEIQIWWDDALRWNGPVISCTGSRTLTFGAEGVLSWTKKRTVDRTSLIYGDPGDPGNPTATPPVAPRAAVLIDQFTIAWSLIAYAQDESVQGHRNFRLDSAAFSPSGVGRSANYKRQEHPFIYDLLQEFPKMFNGFEFDVTLTGDGHRFWTPYYPRKGQFRPEFKMEFGVSGEDRNIASFTYSEDGMNMATQDYATGGSVNGQKIEENYEDVEASNRHGVLQAVTSQGSQLDRAWLHDKARGEVTSRKEPIKTIGVTSVRTKDLDMFGVLTTGDWIPIEINYGRIQVNEKRRVTEIGWNPDDSLSITLGEVMA